MLIQKHLQSRNTSKIDSEFSGHPQWSWNIRFQVAKRMMKPPGERKLKNMYATDAMKPANEDLAMILQINHRLFEEESSDKRSQALVH